MREGADPAGHVRITNRPPELAQSGQRTEEAVIDSRKLSGMQEALQKCKKLPGNAGSEH
jgi:hypothetical protein